MAKPQLLEEVGKVSELKTDNKTVVSGINEVLEKEKSNEEQINVLNGLQNGFKIYKSLAELGATSTNTTSEIIAKMIDNSILITGEAYSDIPINLSTTIIIRVNTSRVSCECTRLSNTYKATWRLDSGFSGWQQIATTSTWTATSDNLNNGWVAWGHTYYPIFTKIGNLVTVNCGFLVSGTVTFGTVIMSDIPAEFIPSKQRIATVVNTSNINPCIIIKGDGTLVIDTTYGVTWSAGVYNFSFTYKL